MAMCYKQVRGTSTANAISFTSSKDRPYICLHPHNYNQIPNVAMVPLEVPSLFQSFSDAPILTVDI